jgi:RNA polymerase sigma-70 factor, ECF subfamily
VDGETSSQDERYRLAASDFGPALERLVRAYEANPDQRHDLLQDIHAALWRSFAGYDGRCSVRTWG